MFNIYNKIVFLTIQASQNFAVTRNDQQAALTVNTSLYYTSLLI